MNHFPELCPRAVTCSSVTVFLSSGRLLCLHEQEDLRHGRGLLRQAVRLRRVLRHQNPAVDGPVSSEGEEVRTAWQKEELWPCQPTLIVSSFSPHLCTLPLHNAFNLGAALLSFGLLNRKRNMSVVMLSQQASGFSFSLTDDSPRSHC